MSEKKRLFSKTRPYFRQGVSCSDCLRMGAGCSSAPERRRARAPGPSATRGERPCALLVSGIVLLAEQTRRNRELPLTDMVREFTERFGRNATQELGVSPNSAGWVDCEKVTGIDWQDPEHETPPDRCVTLADRAVRDLEMIVAKHEAKVA